VCAVSGVRGVLIRHGHLSVRRWRPHGPLSPLDRRDRRRMPGKETSEPTAVGRFPPVMASASWERRAIVHVISAWQTQNAVQESWLT
jgi:hypothetical protein